MLMILLILMLTNMVIPHLSIQLCKSILILLMILLILLIMMIIFNLAMRGSDHDDPGQIPGLEPQTL